MTGEPNMRPEPPSVRAHVRPVAFDPLRWFEILKRRILDINERVHTEWQKVRARKCLTFALIDRDGVGIQAAVE